MAVYIVVEWIWRYQADYKEKRRKNTSKKKKKKHSFLQYFFVSFIVFVPNLLYTTTIE